MAPQPAVLVVTLCLFSLLVTRIADGSENDWLRYENSYFIAYSNAGRWQASKILEDLEYFRAAALRIPNIELPEDTLKTLVLMPATAREFALLAESENSVGFAQPLDGQTVIVFPASSRTNKSKYILHHEYAHALAHVNSVDYPQWYAEGFAEIASSVVIHKRRKSFYVGLHEGRFKEASEPRIDWEELISDQFDAHALDDANLTASAYAQFWLLVHFLTLSGSDDYIFKLEHYFALVEKGEQSSVAFREAFQMTANELWDTELQAYLRHIPEYRHGFGRSTLDTSFERRPAERSEYLPILRFFKDRASISRGMHETSNPLSLVTGQWDHLRFNDQCSNAFDLQLTDGADVLVMDDFYTSQSGRKIPAVFSVLHQYGSELMLANITRSRYPDIALTPNYQLSIRSDDVMCFDEVPATLLCQRVLQRCNR
jgi:hypothetical protein